MSQLVDILNDTDIARQNAELERLIEKLKSDGLTPCLLSDDDTVRLLVKLNTLDNPAVWRGIWTALISSPRNEQIGAYCKLQLSRTHSISETGGRRPDVFLHYLFKHFPDERTQLIADFIDSEFLTLRFAAVEELAKTDLDTALTHMRTIRQEAGQTHFHDIYDATELWLDQASP